MDAGAQGDTTDANAQPGRSGWRAGILAGALMLASIVQPAYRLLVEANHELDRARRQHPFRRVSGTVTFRIPQPFDVTTEWRPRNPPQKKRRI